ncbi:hypothetical protein Vadar_021079 [Vaccinium darrowii]|uniref:Uncharacterized protein n=1 Tax=Vaccinium darrowii TaxID=229202 RepID=A0ACB7Z578_9ERIC|nr:hypothetical protein Vadar_021079 [Vaccinium darrowii]
MEFEKGVNEPNSTRYATTNLQQGGAGQVLAGEALIQQPSSGSRSPPLALLKMVVRAQSGGTIEVAPSLPSVSECNAVRTSGWLESPGCGLWHCGGDFYMVENFDVHVISIDLSVNMVSFALERVIGLNCSVELEVSDCFKKHILTTPLIKEAQEYVKCRKEAQEYVKGTMPELLSEALGLNSDYLSSIECMKSEALTCLYYPFCPEPNLTMGNAKHSNTTFLTVLLQDHNIGGLQILYQNQWADVPSIHGTLIANVGDPMQCPSLAKRIDDAS